MTDDQIRLYAEVRARLPANVRLHSLSALDPFPFQPVDALGARVIGVEGRLGDRAFREMIRADRVQVDPDTAGWWIARKIGDGLGLTRPPRRLWGATA